MFPGSCFYPTIRITTISTVKLFSAWAVIGAIRLSRPQAPWARYLYLRRLDKMSRALGRERTLRRPVVHVKLWLQYAIAGTPRLPSHRLVDAELDREVHPAPPPESVPSVFVSGAGVG